MAPATVLRRLFIDVCNRKYGDFMKVEVNVDGKKVPMNKFVQKIVGSTIKGMIETLDDVGAWKKLNITIEMDKE